MEKILSSEERIRRAEEIYARRKNSTNRKTVATVNVGNKKEYSVLKKMIIQMLICLIIYFIFHLINTTNYIFSEDIISNTKNILNYDIDLQMIINNVQNYMGQFFSNNENNEQDLEKNETNNEEQVIGNEENNTNTETQNTENTESTQNIENGENTVTQEVPLSQMEQDAKYVKENFSLIKPIEGIITSEFGNREVTNNLITPEHYGIDIAANTGTGIKASMEGDVVVATTSQSYGNFVEIKNQNVVTLYAHCNKLNVSVGQHIGQGDIIAEVGQTGDATGPHLHFEIIVDDRKVNPRLVLDF